MNKVKNLAKTHIKIHVFLKKVLHKICTFIQLQLNQLNCRSKTSLELETNFVRDEI